ncbi:Transcriptional regulatory protein ZraR [Anatilimnocola aggregata]|uniref:Transcriptional regulatory protein ZraR n=1 Tax=Anatilimnocola aggregata TaxID=2528021 RepID=A0A517Y7J3_9BACT|nr:sigma-54 dependent transcriptional regulator [Anatilimnocola aggregata]QDU26214.1 Transcriptional regulatory protein ZraR [Anatilimnocola aggregata]
MKPSVVDVLVVDDDEDFRPLLLQKLKRSGMNVDGAANAAEALDLAQRRQFDVAIFDMQMPGMSGLELLEKYKSQFPETEVIVLTGQGTIESAVQAMQLGAFNYLQKPFGLNELEAQIQKAAERRALRKENEQLRTLLARSRYGKHIIGESPSMKEIFRLIERAGPSDRAILIQGESGTGKELVAEALHRSSSRADRPLVAVNCAALPETLLESELFGHEKGSFTGAIAAKQGLFEAADGGTLFIDEIGEMPGALQAKLLRVLENGALRRVGSIQERKVNVRLLAATNRDLRNEIKAGRFREDLYYRINVMSLELPPLRERPGDIDLLVDHFLGDDWHVEDEALQLLNGYNWPGNVRQLLNVLERAKILADDDVIRKKDLPKEVLQGQSSDPATVVHRLATPAQAPDDLNSFQRAKVLSVLQREAFNKAKAARALGISRRKLYRLLEKYDLADASSGTFP